MTSNSYLVVVSRSEMHVMGTKTPKGQLDITGSLRHHSPKAKGKVGFTTYTYMYFLTSGIVDAVQNELSSK